MSSSASTVLTFPLTLREYFWVIARASSICATAVFIGTGHVPVKSHAAASASTKNIPKSAAWEHGSGVELLRRESTLCQRLHGREQSSHVALRNVPCDEHDAA